MRKGRGKKEEMKVRMKKQGGNQGKYEEEGGKEGKEEEERRRKSS